MTEMEMVRIGDYCDVTKGKIGIKKAVAGKYPLVTTSEDRLSHNEYHFEKPSVIIPVVSSTGHGHASLRRIHYHEGKFAVGSILCAVTPKDENILNANYLYHYLDVYKEKLLVSRMKGMANVTLPVKEIENVEFPLLSIEKQMEWVALFEKTTSYTESLTSEITHQQTLLKKLRQSILQDAISGKLTEKWRKENPDVESAIELLARIKAEKKLLVKEKKIKTQKLLSPVSEDEIPFELPERWVMCRLGEITNIVRGGSPRPAGDKRFYDGSIPFLKVADLTKDDSMFVNNHTYTIKKAGLHKTRHVESNTLMLTNSGATLGVPKISTFPTTFNDGIAAFIYMNKGLSKAFLYYFLKMKSEWFLNEASRGQGQPNLNTDIIGDTIIALPPSKEAIAIVLRIEKLLSYCDQLEQQINRSQHDSELLMQAVLQEAFGKN